MSGDRVRSCRTCDLWCPMHGERRAFATLGCCALSGDVMEHGELCSRFSSPQLVQLRAAIAKDREAFAEGITEANRQLVLL